MARIRFALSPAATAATITGRVNPNKKVEPISFFTRGKGKVKSRRAAIARLPKRPLIFQWLHLMSLDFIKMSIFFGAATALRFYTPLFRQKKYAWPMWRDPVEPFWVGPESINRPKIEALSNFGAAIILSLAPLTILLFMQIFVRNFWDFNAALIGLLTAVDIMTVTQLPLKEILDETWNALPEPHRSIPFYVGLSYCTNTTVFGDPVRRTNPLFRNVLDQRRKDELRYEMDAFPSGTTGNAFAVGWFLALYLNAKLKAFSANRTPFWKILAVLAPLFGALMITLILLLMNYFYGMKSSDQFTNRSCSQNSTPLIVIISALMGTAAGFIGYRSHFHAVFDYQQNHLPFVQGPDKPKPKLPLHTLHLPAAIHNHLPSHLHAPHLNIHMPYIFRHRSAEQKRQDEENRWLAVNFQWPGQHEKKGKGGRRRGKGKGKRKRASQDTGVLVAEAIAANVMDAGGGATDAVLGATV
ncbi:MAG: hypothetical protein Q9225_002138 [Loekoesia sp. 1 TL-2023]